MMQHVAKKSLLPGIPSVLSGALCAGAKIFSVSGSGERNFVKRNSPAVLALFFMIH
jgi:hypothetical protein